MKDVLKESAFDVGTSGVKKLHGGTWECVLVAELKLIQSVYFVRSVGNVLRWWVYFDCAVVLMN